MTSASLPSSEITFVLPENAAPLAARLLQLVPTALTVLLLAGLAVLLLLPDGASHSDNQSPPIPLNFLQPARAETPDSDTFTLYLVDSDMAAGALEEALMWYVLHVAPANRGFEIVVASGAPSNDPAALVSEVWQRFQRSDVRFVVIDLRGR
jgi:hypothetical protein